MDIRHAAAPGTAHDNKDNGESAGRQAQQLIINMLKTAGKNFGNYAYQGSQ